MTDIKKTVEVLEVYLKASEVFYALCEKEQVGLTMGRKKFRQDTKEAVLHAIEVLRRVDDVDTIRHALIGRMDLFMEWGKRSYKNTNDLKHENTSDIIEELATAIVKMLKGEG